MVFQLKELDISAWQVKMPQHAMLQMLSMFHCAATSSVWVAGGFFDVCMQDNDAD